MFQAAVTLHQAGRLAEAAAACRHVLMANPRHADALHLAGVIELYSGHMDMALELLTRAIQVNSRSPLYHCHHGDALAGLDQLELAISSYDRAISLQPGYAEAYANRGDVLAALGQQAAALASYDQSIAIDPQHAEAWCNRGNPLRGLGRLDEAVASYDRAVVLRPDMAEAWTNRGVAQLDLEQYGDAIASFDRAVTLRPQLAEAWHSRGQALARSGKLAAAVESYDRALAIRPDHAATWSDRGAALFGQQSSEAALASYDRATGLDPSLAEAWCNRGNVLQALAQFDAALESFDRALALQPEMAVAWHTRGQVLAQSGRPAAAVESYDRALAIRPDHAPAWSDRGAAMSDMQHLEAALACYDRAINSDPSLAEAWCNRGNVLQWLSRFDAALQSYDHALALRPDFPEAQSERIHVRYLTCDWRERQADDAILMDLIHRDQTVAPFTLLATSATPMDRLNCARHWSRRFPRPPAALAQHRDTPNRPRLTVGYISGDFRHHPLAYLIADVLEHHDRRRFNVVCYSLQGDDGSAIRQRIAAGCDRFVDVSGLTDPAAAETIASTETDILVDLSGHTREARPAILASRPAPVQVSYLGYIGSMGADFIDYIVADDIALPMSQQQFYDEKIVQLPVSYQPNGKSRQMSTHLYSRGECGLPQNGFVFCCFNSSYKINPEVFAIWMRLLGAMQGSVLWLVASSPPAEANLRREATSHGIDPDRLIFAPHVSYEEYLARCAVADLFLDTLPYSAGATASDMVWAGLPLLTCLGSDFAGRMAASVLTACGLTELIAGTAADYEALALRLATQPSELTRIRHLIRDKARDTELFDAARCTRNLEAAYIEMRRRHCAGQSPAGFVVPPVCSSNAPEV